MSAALFMSVFTSQAAVLVLSPILVDIAAEFDVSTATAGQLRILAAPVAAVVAVASARFGVRFPLTGLLVAGTALVAAGSLLSAVAPSFLVLALAQVPMWIGIALLVAAGIGAAGSWSDDASRTRLVARALAGAPAAWIVGMPIIGAVAEVNWRLAFVVVPLPAAVVTAVLVRGARPARAQARQQASLGRLFRDRDARRWGLAEVAAMSAWAGTLVYSGALFIETYGTTAQATGLLLAAVAGAYFAGNAVAGRIRGDCRLRRALVRSDLVAAALISMTWIVTPGVLATLALFSAAAAAVAARTVAGTGYGFALAGERKLEVGAARAVFTHVGYLVGSGLGGAALATGGRGTAGVVFGLLVVAAAIPHLGAFRARCHTADRTGHRGSRLWAVQQHKGAPPSRGRTIEPGPQRPARA